MKITIISSSEIHMEVIRQMLLANAPARQVSSFKAGAAQLSAMAGKEHPDLIILDGTCYGVSELRELEQLLQRDPGLAILALCENPSSEFLIGAMRVGVRDVLPLPVTPEILLEAVTRVEQRQRPAANSSQPRGKVMAFIACKGGSGATFLASNLGYNLAARAGAKVALLDLNLQFGDAALFMSDHVPVNTLADVTDNIARLDASFLTASMVQVLPNYGLLAAPEEPERAVGITPEHIEALLNMAKTNYDYVILDVGRTFSAASVKALDQADMIFPVLQGTLPFIRDSKRLIHTLQTLGYAGEKIRPIANRHTKGADIRLEDVESALGMKVFKAVPNSYEAVSNSVNQGVPLLKLAKNDAVTKALNELVHDLLEEGKPAKNAGWLSHIFRPNHELGGRGKVFSYQD